MSNDVKNVNVPPEAGTSTCVDRRLYASSSAPE